jgi:thiosulfate dehydrogenase (quinone) large subunit
MAQIEAASPATNAGIRGFVKEIQSVDELRLAYSIFRITLGVNIFFHGAMRLITGLEAWVTMQAKVFENNPILPMWSVQAFLFVLPFVEVFLGALTTLGLYTRWALLGGSAMMFVLVFGNLTRQDWGTVGNNMHYVLYYALMIAALRFNAYALDTRKST